jgi:membrane protein implicated in regulation of membrane protease activity
MPINFDAPGRPARNLAARVASAVFMALAFGLALMFSVVVFAGLALAALAFWIWWRWQTRALRRAMRERGEGFESPFDGTRGTIREEADVIDGEAVRVDEERKRLE